MIGRSHSPPPEAQMAGTSIAGRSSQAALHVQEAFLTGCVHVPVPVGVDHDIDEIGVIE